jgi:hypothetical protein
VLHLKESIRFAINALDQFMFERIESVAVFLSIKLRHGSALRPWKFYFTGGGIVLPVE